MISPWFEGYRASPVGDRASLAGVGYQRWALKDTPISLSDLFSLFAAYHDEKNGFFMLL